MEALVRRIDDEQGRLDVLVNDVWGGENLELEWNTPVWEHSLDSGLKMLHPGAVAPTSSQATSPLPLLIRRPGGLVVEMTDGTREYNAAHYRLSAFYDLAKWAVLRLAFSQAEELKPSQMHSGGIDSRVDAFGNDAGALWGDRGELAGRSERLNPHFAAISESPRFVGHAVAALAADPDAGQPHRGFFLLRWPWPGSTDSPMSTGRGRTAGATSQRCRTLACRRLPPDTADLPPTPPEAGCGARDV